MRGTFLLDCRYADGWADLGKHSCGVARALPIGKLSDPRNQFAALVKAGGDGIDAGRGQALRSLIIIHHDQGADAAGAKALHDTFNSYNIGSHDVGCDVIGLSYCP